MQPTFQMRTLTGLVAGALSLATLSAQGAGFAIIENSASGLGNAFAGAAAVAEDASTIYFNPAGMTHLPGSQLVAAGHYIMPTADFRNRGSHVNPLLTGGVPVAGTLPGPNADGGVNKFVPNLFLSTQLGETLFAGIGINAPFGLATKYSENWVGRYHAIESDIKTVNINPSIAWQANEMISIGGGISAQYIDTTLSNAVDFGSICFGLEGAGVIPDGTCAGAGVLPLEADGKAEVKGTDWSWGFNLGALVNLTERSRIGVAYRSQVSHTLEGRAKFQVPANFQAILDIGLPLFTNTGAKASTDLPETFSMSFYHAFNDQWAVLADATWTKWSRFDELRIQYHNPHQPDTAQPENWDDSWRYSLGATYQPSDKWIFRVGWAYDETPIRNAQYRTPRIPGNDRTWIAFGAGYRISETMAVDVGYAHLFVDDTGIDALDHSTGHQLVGEYQSDVDIISAQLKVNF